MRVTQKDIARKLNLSQSLVTGVLNNRPGVWASAETRQRVLQAAQELNYQPNAAAQALRRGRTNVVACALFGSVGYQAIVEALAVCLAEIGYDLLVRVIHDVEQNATPLETLLSGGKCDALVLWGLEHEIEAVAPLLQRARCPFVAKGRYETSHPEWNQIDFDHEGMMETVVHHLAAHGHRRIAYLGYANDLRYTQRLLRGYRQAMKSLAEQGDGYECVASVSDESGADAAFAEWMAQPENSRPTAVAIGTALSHWLDIERWLAARGQRIGPDPGQIALAGAGGNEMALLFGEGEAFLDAELITLAQHMASQMLVPLLRGQTLTDNIVRVLPTLRPLKSMSLPLGGSASTFSCPPCPSHLFLGATT